MDDATMCMRPTNIGRRGVQQRWIVGIVALTAAVGYAALTFIQPDMRIYRVADFIPLAVGVMGILQARART